MELLRTNLLDIFYEHVDESDWLEGLDLYQAGKVDDLADYSGLITAKVLSNVRVPAEVRLKIHPSGKRIQWIECTCAKYRTTGRYCEHMAAFMINLDREKPQLIGKLDTKMPIKPPNITKRAKAKQAEKDQPDRSLERLDGAAQTILSHLKGNIHSVSLLAKGPQIRVRIAIKPGTLTHYNLDTDSAAKFLLAHPRPPGAHEEVKELRVYTSQVMRGTRLYLDGPEVIVAERVLAIRHNTKSREKAERLDTKINTVIGEYRHFSNDLPKGRRGIYEFLPVKSSQKYAGKEYLFLPKRGYWPIAHDSVIAKWNDLPLKKTFKDDEAAKLIQSGFQDYLECGPIFLDEALEDPTIDQDLSLKEIKVIKQDEGWFYLDPSYASGEATVSMVELIEQYRQNKRRYIKTGKLWLKIPDFIRDGDWGLDQSGKYLKVNTIGLMRLKAALGDFDQFVGKKNILKSIRQNLEFKEGEKTPTLDQTQLDLRDYQKAGLEWLWWLYRNGLHGLLADEMGLGKTHQAMAVLSAIQTVKKDAKFIVIAPTTVIDHWIDKIENFCPALMPLRHHGTKRYQNPKSMLEGHHTIVTSYGVLLRDSRVLSQISFDAVVLDEAHFIKNNVTATYRSVCHLESRFRVCLTGTPLENHLGELKNIFDFLMPGYLGSDEYFKKVFLAPILEGKSPDTEWELQKLIHPFKMRRTKDQVLKELPEKVEDYRYCELSKEQVKLYKEVLSLKGAPVLQQLQDNDQPVPYLHVFHVLTLLKQICDHPSLVKDGLDYKNHESGKFEVFKELLGEALGSGFKVVIYSQYLKMIDLVSTYLKDEQIDHVTLTGQTRNRGKVIDRFQTDPDCKVFCGSLMAGGIGIDLTAASVVIHYDRWWNASKENQATDRVHRIGQHKNVQVFKLVTKGTLEEKIDLLIGSKQSLFEKFIDKDDEIFNKLDRQQLIELLS